MGKIWAAFHAFLTIPVIRWWIIVGLFLHSYRRIGQTVMALVREWDSPRTSVIRVGQRSTERLQLEFNSAAP
jgi:hypothetical protein